MMTELFTPAKIGNCEIPNRLIVPAMVMNLCTEDGMITERYIKYIEEKAKGGSRRGRGRSSKGSTRKKSS